MIDKTGKDISRIEEVIRGNAFSAGLLNPTEPVVPMSALPEILEFIRMTNSAPGSCHHNERLPLDAPASARLSQIASELLVAGYMTSPRSLDRLKRQYEDKILDFVCDEMRRMIKAGTRPTPFADADAPIDRQRIRVDAYSHSSHAILTGGKA
jgi:hypothetical protein